MSDSDDSDDLFTTKPRTNLGFVSSGSEGGMYRSIRNNLLHRHTNSGTPVFSRFTREPTVPVHDGFINYSGEDDSLFKRKAPGRKRKNRSKVRCGKSNGLSKAMAYVCQIRPRVSVAGVQTVVCPLELSAWN
eukprot:1183502-Prorocentrum_minimum.AAC.2